jgi:hypothetical protein
MALAHQRKCHEASIQPVAFRINAAGGAVLGELRSIERHCQLDRGWLVHTHWYGANDRVLGSHIIRKVILLFNDKVLQESGDATELWNWEPVDCGSGAGRRQQMGRADA